MVHSKVLCLLALGLLFGSPNEQILRACEKRCSGPVSFRWLSEGVRMNRLLKCVAIGLALLANTGFAGSWISAPQGSATGLMQRLDRAKWIATGAKSAERVVYMFTDPDCPFCNDLWKAMQKARAPEVQIRYLLVAVIDADSKGKDVAILEAKDPAAALDKSERNFEHGGIAPKVAALPETAE